MKGRSPPAVVPGFHSSTRAPKNQIKGFLDVGVSIEDVNCNSATVLSVNLALRTITNKAGEKTKPLHNEALDNDARLVVETCLTAPPPIV